MPSQTPMRLLLDNLTSDTLEVQVAKLRSEGQSWRTIADTISRRTGVPVSHESLRSWFAEQKRPA